jgi:hypothetical protein
VLIFLFCLSFCVLRPILHVFLNCPFLIHLLVFSNIFLLERKNMDVNEHERLSNFTLRHKSKVKAWHAACLAEKQHISHWKLTCSRHDIAEKLLNWHVTTITHLLSNKAGLCSVLKTLLWLWNMEQQKNVPCLYLWFVSKCKVGKSLWFFVCLSFCVLRPILHVFLNCPFLIPF